VPATRVEDHAGVGVTTSVDPMAGFLDAATAGSTVPLKYDVHVKRDAEKTTTVGRAIAPRGEVRDPRIL